MIHIGTSGYSFKDWKGPFYPIKIANEDMLEFYSRHFKVVEINATYYAIPKPRTFERMADRTPTTHRPWERKAVSFLQFYLY